MGELTFFNHSIETLCEMRVYQVVLLHALVDEGPVEEVPVVRHKLFQAA